MAFFATNPEVARAMTADREGAFRNQQAQMAARAAVEQARIQAQTQQAALQQQAMQRDQANQLAQQAQAENAFFNRGRLQNEQLSLQQQAANQERTNQLALQAQAEAAFFNRGRLTNEQTRIEADKALALAAAAEAENRFKLEDATRRYIADQGVIGKTAGIVSGGKEDVLAAGNYAKALKEQEGTQSMLATLDAIEEARKQRGGEFFTFNSTAEKEALAKLAPILGADAGSMAGLSYQETLARARAKLQARLGSLNRIVDAGQQSGISSLVSPTEGGGWSSGLEPVTQPQIGPVQGQGAFSGNGVPVASVAPQSALAPKQIVVRSSDGQTLFTTSDKFAEIRRRDPGAQQINPNATAPALSAASPERAFGPQDAPQSFYSLIMDLREKELGGIGTKSPSYLNGVPATANPNHSLASVIAKTLNVQPQRLGSSTLQKDPRSVVADNMEFYLEQLQKLPVEVQRQVYQEAMKQFGSNPQQKLPWLDWSLQK